MHFNSTSFPNNKGNKLSFPRTETGKPLPTSVHRISQVRLKFRSQLMVLPSIRNSDTFKVCSSVISIDSNVMEGIIRRILSVQQEKKRAGLRIELQGKPALAGQSCQDFPSQLSRSLPFKTLSRILLATERQFTGQQLLTSPQHC